MRSVGLITEYNPFHNGHLHHLQESKRVSGADVTVAVMSGHFLQRGEPALLDKWVRAEMALAAGVDLVVELPLPWACNSAPYFARGAVQALSAMGVDTLCFGSEIGDLDVLKQCAGLLEKHQALVARHTEALLRQGINYPEARQKVFAGLTDRTECLEAIGSPNNILGIEYLRALHCADTAIEPFTIQRIGAGYHDSKAAPGGIASATGIRRMLGEKADVTEYIPPSVLGVLERATGAGRVVDFSHLHRLLVTAILRDGERLDALYQVEHGLARRLIEAARTSRDYEGLVETAKSRHLTRTRVQRLLAYVLLGLEAAEMEAYLGSGPLYLHLLGYSERGREFLAAGRKCRSLPLISNYSRVHAALKRSCGKASLQFRLAEKMLNAEVRATALYSLLMFEAPDGDRNRDFYRDPVGLEGGDGDGDGDG
ncbi:MAG: nucleotidyltransferase [Desulfuromonadales bacterium]